MAAITEWDFLNSNGTDDFVEVYLAPGEDAADFAFSTYERDGDLRQEISLADVADATTQPDGSQIFIIRGSDIGQGTFWLDGLGTGANSVNSAALVDVSGPTNTLVDFYTTDRDPATAAITPTTGAAAGFTSTALEAENLNNASYNWDINGENQNLGPQNPGDVVCFAAGTLIKTPDGERLVEDLKAGDLVMTLDHGALALVWTGRRDLGSQDLSSRPEWRPIRISACSLDGHLPTRDLTVSPEHRVLVQSARSSLLFGTTQILVPASDLDGQTGVDRDASCNAVTYVHIMCDAHQVVWANGQPCESFHPNSGALSRGEERVRSELIDLFPQLEDSSAPALVRPVIRRPEGQLLQG